MLVARISSMMLDHHLYILNLLIFVDHFSSDIAIDFALYYFFTIIPHYVQWTNCLFQASSQSTLGTRASSNTPSTTEANVPKPSQPTGVTNVPAGVPLPEMPLQPGIVPWPLKCSRCLMSPPLETNSTKNSQICSINSMKSSRDTDFLNSPKRKRSPSSPSYSPERDHSTKKE
jgi:hypothetical protein